MNTIVYVGMDVHKESYTLCCYCYDTDKVEYKQTIPSDYKLVLKYMESMRSRYEGDVSFVCGYEAHTYCCQNACLNRNSTNKSRFFSTARILTHNSMSH